MMPRRFARMTAVLASLPLFVGSTGGEDTSADSDVRRATFLSESYVVDREYRSMKGPQSSQTIYLGQRDPEELLWVTGFSAVMVGEDGESPMSQEFMCHSNLDMNMRLHRRLFDMERETPNRVFTLSQGQQELRFPDGFGLPILSSEPFRLTTQVLNLNDGGQSFRVRHRVEVEYVADDPGRTMKPLMQLAANGLVLVDGEDPYYDIPEADPEIHGPGCLVGTSATGNDHHVTDSQGRRFSGHWLVKPGRQVNHTNVTRFMDLPFDTTVHYIAVHLHPFAESLELRDLTAGATVFKSHAQASDGRIGLDRVDYFSSETGLPLFVDHEYELISVYDNTSGTNQDSMAVMYLYVLDKEFRRPSM